MQVTLTLWVLIFLLGVAYTAGIFFGVIIALRAIWVTYVKPQVREDKARDS